MRTPAFAPGTRVLLADQWIETGGTMDGAIRLIERQGGVVTTLVAIVIEENERTRGYRRKLPLRLSCFAGHRVATSSKQSISGKLQNLQT